MEQDIENFHVSTVACGEPSDHDGLMKIGHVGSFAPLECAENPGAAGEIGAPAPPAGPSAKLTVDMACVADPAQKAARVCRILPRGVVHREVRERAVRLVLETIEQCGEHHGANSRIARQLGTGTETLRSWVNQADVDDGGRSGQSTEHRASSTTWRRKAGGRRGLSAALHPTSLPTTRDTRPLTQPRRFNVRAAPAINRCRS
jgi:transposase